MSHPNVVFQTALRLDRAAAILSRTARSGLPPQGDDVTQLRAARQVCADLSRVWRAGVRDGAWRGEREEVAALLAEMVQPWGAPERLEDPLVRAVSLFDSLLLSTRPEHGSLRLHPSQTAWGVEFLSSCSHTLFRAIATRALEDRMPRYGT
ncbi:MAG: hypothetical protein VKP62_02625 [Candidatus Sericytochromatia bacterium]|nr:hypothetical protein [Candidatus Sericytochromatia bacterium]